MPPITNSGIRTSAEGLSYIPSSTRADGTKRKQIRVRPGFTPQEDVETYKSKNAEAWKNRGSGGVPGAESVEQDGETKSKNAKRREAARKRQAAESLAEKADDLVDSLGKVNIVKDASEDNVQVCERSPDPATLDEALDLDNQKKVRNLLKKLSGVQDLKARKATGEKLSPDQLMKIGREQEILRDLKKHGYQETIVEKSEDVSVPVADGDG